MSPKLVEVSGLLVTETGPDISSPDCHDSTSLQVLGLQHDPRSQVHMVLVSFPGPPSCECEALATNQDGLCRLAHKV